MVSVRDIKDLDNTRKSTRSMVRGQATRQRPFARVLTKRRKRASSAASGASAKGGRRRVFLLRLCCHLGLVERIARLLSSSALGISQTDKSAN